MAKNLDNITGIVYRLKRDFGVAVSYVVKGSSTTNRQTGVVTRTSTSYTIKRVIVLEAQDIKNHITVQQFKDAGFYDTSRRGFIIDAADINFVPKKDDTITYQSKTYGVEVIHPVAETKSYLIIAKAEAT